MQPMGSNNFGPSILPPHLSSPPMVFCSAMVPSSHCFLLHRQGASSSSYSASPKMVLPQKSTQYFGGFGSNCKRKLLLKYRMAHQDGINLLLTEFLQLWQLVGLECRNLQG